MTRKLLIQNIIKNVVLVIILVISSFVLSSYIDNADFIDDTAVIGNLIIVVSIIAVTACFGNFAFTYEKVELTKKPITWLAHLTTGILMLVVGVSLIMTDILARELVGSFPVLSGVLLLLYLGIVGYDFWDLLRIIPSGNIEE